MKRRDILRLMGLSFLLLISLSASCVNLNAGHSSENAFITSATIANPASVYCSDVMGYKYEVVNGSGDEQIGLCILPNGERCGQWDFYAGTCGRDYSYCAQQGYRIRTLHDGKGSYAQDYATCVSPTGQVIGSVAQLSDLQARVARRGSEYCPLPDMDLDLIPDSEGVSPNLEGQTADILTPSSFDWRSYQGHNWLTDIKNQDSCGSCWAFAAVGLTEAHHNIIASNPYLDLDLAEQELVSCSDAGSCSGGSTTSALAYIRDFGIVDESCMSYTASDSSCSKCGDWRSRLTHVDRVHGFIPNGSSIRQAVVEHGPVYAYIKMDAYPNAYFDGNDIYRCVDDSATNHAVVIVGYNNAGGYWIVRNSWGPGWNDDGYFRVGYGECGIDSTYAGYATQVVWRRVFLPVILSDDNSPIVPGDPYEPDNYFTESTSISPNGSSQRHTFHIPGDEDWVKFETQTGYEYVIETANLQGGADTYIGLFWDHLHDGHADLITTDDDSGEGLASRIVWTASRNDTHYVKVRDYNPGSGGTDVAYDIWVTSTAPQGDSYEPDDTPDQANWIAHDSQQSHSIVPADDVDWVKFNLSGPSQVILETSGDSGDTRLWLYDSNLNEIEFDDDDGDSTFSYIDRLCGSDALSSGTYYVKVDEYYNNDEIYDYSISLEVADCGFSYFDDFSNVNSGWPRVHEDSYSLDYQNGEYQFALYSSDLRVMTVLPTVGTIDYVVEADMRMYSGSPVRYGIIFDWLDWSNYYIFSVSVGLSGNSYSLERIESGNWYTLIDGSSSSHINNGYGTNHLEVTKYQDLIEVRVNGHGLGIVTGGAFSGNLRTGLYGKSGGSVPVVARMDDYSIQEFLSARSVDDDLALDTLVQQDAELRIERE